MIIFTPPTLDEIPAYFNNGAPPNCPPLGNTLLRFYRARPAGAAVFKMSDGTYYINRQIPGLTGPIAVEPWPALPLPTTLDGTPYQTNNAIAQVWNGYTPGVMIEEVQSPYVVIVYYGGHQYPVSAAVAADLTAHGLGAYIT